MNGYIVRKNLETGRTYGRVQCTEKHKKYEGKVIKTLGKLVSDKVMLVYEGLDFDRKMLAEVKSIG